MKIRVNIVKLLMFMFMYENLSLCFPLSVWIEEFEYIIINYFIAYAHYNINNIMLYIIVCESNSY